MIKTFVVCGLNGTKDYELEFNPDVNIITGKNGSGKTTLLKLIWYMLSPNIERTVPEIKFESAKLDTDSFSLEIIRKSDNKNEEQVSIEFRRATKRISKLAFPSSQFRHPSTLENVEGINRLILDVPTGSVFFPTFRRIEGGFSLEPDRYMREDEMMLGPPIREVMAAYSQRMSVLHHKFIASFSTSDIEDLLTKKYAEISEKTNRLQTRLSQFITTTISEEQETKKTKNKKQPKPKSPEEVLNLIMEKVDANEKQREQHLKPFQILSKIIADIFKDKGIHVSPNLSFGETKKAIRASILSAGEKQMLSFICYNAFCKDIPIFIDEPELSLHIDWQRILLPTLLSQETGNQFVLSTHSPFIYSKYPEKEMVLDIDRGGK